MTDIIDPARQLARYAANMNCEDIPEKVLSHAALLLKDTIACMFAGSGADGMREIRDSFGAWGGLPQARIVCLGGRMNAPSAAFINAVMAHARDFDDTHDGAIHHGCVTLVPALLAVTDWLEYKKQNGLNKDLKSISGREFVSALAIGLDVANRIGMAFIPYLHTGWLPTTLWGPISCAAACGRLLNFDHEKMENAFGFAYSSIHGNREALVEGRLAKRIQVGYSAQAGIQAIAFADRKLTAAKNIVDGVFGIRALYANGNCDSHRITNQLGTEFETSNVSIKPYPSCRCTHAVIDAALDLCERYGIKPEQIKHGEILLPPKAMRQVGRRLSIRDNPTVDAQFSAVYTASIVFTNGRVTLADFTPGNIHESKDITKLADRFTCKEAFTDHPGLLPVKMSLELYGGCNVEVTVEKLKGSLASPLTTEEFAAKFNDCLDNANQNISPGRRKSLSQQLDDVLELKDITELAI